MNLFTDIGRALERRRVMGRGSRSLFKPMWPENSKMALGTRLIETHTQTHRNTYSDKYINVVIYLRRSVRREFSRTFSLSTFGTEEKRYIFAAFSVRTIRSCCFYIALTYLV